MDWKWNGFMFHPCYSLRHFKIDLNCQNHFYKLFFDPGGLTRLKNKAGIVTGNSIWMEFS